MNFEEMSKEELIEYIKNINETNNGKYGLLWDKEKEPEKIIEECNKNIPILKEIENKKIENEGENNILIEGDNFHALEALNYTHEEAIDIIYIDPPYHTGKNDFIYNDKFIDEEDGYRHSKWLNFMYKRLKIARNLLKKDGVIFISIDDNEFAQLKLLCDKVFGEKNFISMLSVENNPKGRKNSKFISGSNEYCLIYAKNKNESYFIENIPKSEKDLIKDENENYVQKGGKRVLVGENKYNKPVEDIESEKNYTVYYNPETNDIKIKTEKSINDINQELTEQGYTRYYSYNKGKLVQNTYTKAKFEELFYSNKLEIKENKIYEKNYSTTIRLKSMIVNKKYTAIINNQKVKNYEIDVKTTSAGTALKKMFNTKEKIFDNPKNVGLLKLLISLKNNKDATILDFFAGSGTTAQAVIELNQADNGKRKFIICTNNENQICEKVTYPRIKTIITGKREDGTKYSEGNKETLRYYKTDFIKNEGTKDQIYYDLTEKSIPMICIKENTHEQIEKNDQYAIYTNKQKNKYTCIYFDTIQTQYKEFIEKVKQIKEKKKLYIFTLGNEIEEQELKEIKNYKIEAIPQKIYDKYKKTSKISNEK